MTVSADKITCAICGAQEHVIKSHLEKCHPEVTLEQYKQRYPDAPMLSAYASDLLARKKAEREAQAQAEAAGETTLAMAGAGAAATVTSILPKGSIVKKPLNDLFKLGTAPAALSARGQPIPISTLTEHDDEDLVPDVNDGYVYDIDELKSVLVGIELNIPVLLWGHKGSGKSEMFEQIAARTNRAQMRVQHTVNTEESHIVGQWIVKDGETIFELGPLPVAMQKGWIYCADEYDFGQPSVLSVYQAVLEGKPLIIKEAPAHLRVIRPHENFRFVATGNTNGSGDESGLYQGTLIQNSANYDRFGIVVNKKYMAKAAEQQILINRCKLVPDDAEKMVEFATHVRNAYDAGKISDTISPRALIFASRVGVIRGSFRQGLMLAFINKLSKIDREVCEGLSQRVFGS